MIVKKTYIAALLCVLTVAACASAPKMQKPQYSQWYYSFSVLFDPEEPEGSPQLDLSMSLLQMHYPKEQAEYLRGLLYSAPDLDTYKDRIIREQRENYRGRKMTRGEESPPEEEENFNWRYAETVRAIYTGERGITVERDYEIYTGGANSQAMRRYYPVDLEGLRVIKIDDLFPEYQGDETRNVVYRELRKYSGLDEDQPLSEGIFFSDEPELSFNFFFTQEGLGLHWDPYEITPRSEGGVTITLPWRDIRPLMLSSGIELLTKFNIYLFVV
ncbi:MAG: RsiV family protein [Treponema sp.]|nr:RsiV family protein [Treponema sp.]